METQNELLELSNAIDKALKIDSTLEEILNSLKIDPKEIIQKPQTAWLLKNLKNDEFATLGTMGNFSLIIGKAKAKKSFFINIAVSTAISTDVVLGRFKSELPLEQNEILYFDTEQSKWHVQQALKRICRRVNIDEPQNLHVYGLRSRSPSERLELIEFAIYNNSKVGFVVIDGIKDLVTSINDESEATMIASKLLKWTEERNIHIVTVLHQNKSDNNARGHIGTELINKAETVLSVTKSEADNSISIVEPQQCRNLEPEIFSFEVIDGLPVNTENFELRTETRKNKFDITDLEDSKKIELLKEAYIKEISFSYAELVRRLKLVFNDVFSKKVGDNQIKMLISDFKNRDWLLQDKQKAPYTLGNLE